MIGTCLEVRKFVPDHLIMFHGGNDDWGLFESLGHVKQNISEDRGLKRVYLEGGFVPGVMGTGEVYLESLGVQRLTEAVTRYLFAIQKINDAVPTSCKKYLFSTPFRYADSLKIMYIKVLFNRKLPQLTASYVDIQEIFYVGKRHYRDLLCPRPENRKMRCTGNRKMR